MDADNTLTDAEKRTHVFFVSTAFVLLSVIIIALVYLATGTTTAAIATLSFAGGVSNIFLPCTLPLIFLSVLGILGVNALPGLLRRCTNPLSPLWQRDERDTNGCHEGELVT